MNEINNVEIEQVQNEQPQQTLGTMSDPDVIYLPRLGKTIRMAELDGLDEMIAAKIAGAELNNGAGVIQYRTILLAFSVVEIDGKPVKRPSSLNEVRAFMKQFKMKDTAIMQKKFQELNDPTGETSASE